MEGSVDGAEGKPVGGEGIQEEGQQAGIADPVKIGFHLSFQGREGRGDFPAGGTQGFQGRENIPGKEGAGIPKAARLVLVHVGGNAQRQGTHVFEGIPDKRRFARFGVFHVEDAVFLRDGVAVQVDINGIEPDHDL